MGSYVSIAVRDAQIRAGRRRDGNKREKTDTRLQIHSMKLEGSFEMNVYLYFCGVCGAVALGLIIGCAVQFFMERGYRGKHDRR